MESETHKSKSYMKKVITLIILVIVILAVIVMWIGNHNIASDTTVNLPDNLAESHTQIDETTELEDSVTCDQFSSQSEAQAFYEANGGPEEDLFRLDVNENGIACEATRVNQDL